MGKGDISLVPLDKIPDDISPEYLLRIMDLLVATNFDNVTEPEIDILVEAARKMPNPLFSKIIGSIPFEKIRKYTDDLSRIEPKNKPTCHPWTIAVFDKSYNLNLGIRAGGYNFLIYNEFAVALKSVPELIVEALRKYFAKAEVKLINNYHFRTIYDLENDEFLKKYDRHKKVKRQVKKVLRALNRKPKKFKQDYFILLVIDRFLVKGIYEIVKHKLFVKRLAGKFRITRPIEEP